MPMRIWLITMVLMSAACNASATKTSQTNTKDHCNDADMETYSSVVITFSKMEKDNSDYLELENSLSPYTSQEAKNLALEAKSKTETLKSTCDSWNDWAHDCGKHQINCSFLSSRIAILDKVLNLPIKTPKEVSISALKRAYNDNEVRADIIYKGELLVVNTTVNRVSTGILGVPQLWLGSGYIGDAEAELTDYSQYADLHKGQPITLICIGGGKIMVPLLKDCKIIEP